MPPSADNSSSLEDIKLPEIQVPGADAAALFDQEKDDLDKAAQREAAGIANETARARLEQRKQDRSERKKYAKKLFFLISIWLVFIALIILLAGKLFPVSLVLSDTARRFGRQYDGFGIGDFRHSRNLPFPKI